MQAIKARGAVLPSLAHANASIEAESEAKVIQDAKVVGAKMDVDVDMVVEAEPFVALKIDDEIDMDLDVNGEVEAVPATAAMVVKLDTETAAGADMEIVFDAEEVDAEVAVDLEADREPNVEMVLEEVDVEMEPESEVDMEWEPGAVVEAESDDKSNAPMIVPSKAAKPRSIVPAKRNKFLNLAIANEDRVENDALDMSSRYTESTARKMQMAFRVYSEVCALRKWDPLEKTLPDERLLQFVYLCLHKDYKIQYGLESFRDVYVPALFRHFDREGYTYSDGIRARIKNKIHSMVTREELAPEQIPKERGAEPICTWDLEYIASVYPKGCRDRAQVMAWMAVGLHTGVRGISLESAVWEDAKLVQPSEQAPHFKQLTIVFRVTKGDPNWHHAVTIEGSTLNASGSDPIYWLNQLLKQRVNDASAELTQSSIALLEGQLFAPSEDARISKSTMSARVEAVGRYCGYPERMLTNHGLRAGFLCTALLKHAVNPEQEVHFSGVWTKCALVAGWTVNSKHMEGYCKQAFLRCIVSSRLIMGGTLERGTEEIVANIAGVGAVAKNRLTPCHFHGLRELVPRWPESTKTQIWVDQLTDSIRNTLKEERPELEGPALIGAESYVCTRVYLQLAKMHNLYERESGAALSAASKEARDCVKDWIISKFESEPEPWWISSFIANDVQPIVTTLALAYDFDEDRSRAMQKRKKRKEKKKRERVDADDDDDGDSTVLPSKQAKAKLKRFGWTTSETAALCQGVIRLSGAKWAEISEAPELKRRNNVQCKDRMRVLMKQYQSKDMIRVAEQWLEDNPVPSEESDT